MNPPPIPQHDEYQARWEKGARNLADLDPEFWKWYRNQAGYADTRVEIIVLGVIAFTAAVVAAWLWGIA